MKNRIILFFFLGLFCSCNDWLEVEPKNRIDKKKLFSSEAGFQNALNGIYQMCGETTLYGKNLSWGMLSIIAQQYDNGPINDYTDRYFSLHEYEESNTLTVIDAVWSGLYNAIANCNLLIKEVSVVPPSMFVLDTVTRNVILGEALALRAFCHLDIIRLFAPAPIKQDQKALIPYQASYPSDFTQAYNASEAIDRVIEDLLKAKDLVVYNDTVYHKNQMRYSMSARFMGQYTASGGDFFNKRGYRLNYCAIVGMLARAYMYKGDKVNAQKYAYEIYNTYTKKNTWFKFNPDYDFSTSLAYKQKKHLEDCLFAFYNDRLLDIVEEYYRGSGSLNVLDVGNIFKDDEDDYRLYLINREGTNYTYSIKYRMVNDFQRDNYEGKAIPVLRLSEIYHILIECYYDTNQAEALRLLKEFRSARGCKRIISTIGNKEELYTILINDARREFIGEGQLFFYYKRLNKGIKVPDSEIAPKESIFTLRIPDSQYIY